MELLKREEVQDYRRCMERVDKADILKSYYEVDRKSKKWWHWLFWHFLDTVLVNSYRIFTRKTGKKITLKEFRLDVVVGLVGTNTTKQTPMRKRARFGLDKFKPHVPDELRFHRAKHMPVHGSSQRTVGRSSVNSLKIQFAKCYVISR